MIWLSNPMKPISVFSFSASIPNRWWSCHGQGKASICSHRWCWTSRYCCPMIQSILSHNYSESLVVFQTNNTWKHEIANLKRFYTSLFIGIENLQKTIMAYGEQRVWLRTQMQDSCDLAKYIIKYFLWALGISDYRISVYLPMLMTVLTLGYPFEYKLETSMGWLETILKGGGSNSSSFLSPSSS